MLAHNHTHLRAATIDADVCTAGMQQLDPDKTRSEAKQ
jgi:hypothetical protein